MKQWQVTFSGKFAEVVEAIARREGISKARAVEMALLLFDHISKNTAGSDGRRQVAIYDYDANAVTPILLVDLSKN